MSGLINKVKEAVHSDKKDNAATDNPQSSNAGPHGSNMANKADPRVDSDRDNIHSQTHGTGMTGTTGTTGAGYGGATTGTTGGAYNDPRSTNAGPHSSNIANTADPRVDSDRDGRGLGHGTAGTAGTAYGSSTSGTGYGSSTAGTGYGSSGAGIGSTGATTGAGYGSTTGAGLDDPRSTNAGPHSSNMANKADPRVDSDRDGRGLGQGAAGTAGTAFGGSGGGIDSTRTTGASGAGYGDPRSTNAGPHSSNMANKADPRVDSDMDGRGGLGTSGVGHTSHTGYGQGTTGAGVGATGAGYGSSATPGSGNTSKTAGPHNSDLMNKLDPRVDSDMDGSKTVGGNATHR